MKWSIPAIIFCISTARTSGFMSQETRSNIQTVSSGIVSKNKGILTNLSNKISPSSLKMASIETDTDHDVVTVDLAGGRDYPIYIGADFDDKTGNSNDHL